jgi:hypothetical protein
LKEKIIRDSKQLQYPKWKGFFDSMFVLGAFLLVSKLIIFTLNNFVGTEITILKDIGIAASFLPFSLMVIGGIGSDSLKKKYVD